MILVEDESKNKDIPFVNEDSSKNAYKKRGESPPLF